MHCEDHDDHLRSRVEETSLFRTVHNKTRKVTSKKRKTEEHRELQAAGD